MVTQGYSHLRYTGCFVRWNAVLLIAGSLFAGGCTNPPDPFPPPMQRPVAAPEAKPAGVRTFIAMSDPEAPDAIVADIQSGVEGTGWRWTHQNPELRFTLPGARGWKFAMDFSLPKPNFKDTGPVTISFFINAKPLDKVRYTSPGDLHYEKAVPAAWLKAGEYNNVRAEVDPPWIAPSDKAKLGFVLHRAGFIH